jgi:membrane protease YdiL (CAAX protease family)
MQTTRASHPGVQGQLLPMLRRQPLVWYFVLANAFSWVTLFLLGGWLDLPAQLVVLIFTLLGIPLVILVATLVQPGAAASFAPMSPVRWLVTYVIVFVVTGIAGGPLLEEIGWRGFALPRMQAQLGPLHGTLLLGGLWAVWHVPQYLVLPEWVAENGGSDPASIGAFLLLVLGLTPTMTWLFNRTRGSVLVAILAHGSVNTALQMVPAQLFPTLAVTLVPVAVAFAVVALVLIVMTRGRLGLAAHS